MSIHKKHQNQAKFKK